MFSSILSLSIAFSSLVAAQSSPAVVCIAGQCAQGYSNTTIGAKLSAPGASTSVLLLPGQYTSTTNPQLLHNLLTSSSASLSPSAGFENATVSLPLDLELSAGLAIYSESVYSGQSAFTQLPSSPVVNTSTPLTAKSFALASNVWVAVSAGSSDRVIFWDSVPDVSQLPSTGSLSLLDMQSSACSPSCSGSGVCSASGQCICPAGFAGTSCESCDSGFFGPSCQACPEGCSKCDEGINGTGRCLDTTVANAPSTCNCQNGSCGSDGSCTCNDGWTTGDNGTACAKCSDGFFLSSTGDCKVCAIGCKSCADETGACNACKTGFTQDANDRTKCNAAQSVTSTGTVCPDGSFSSGTSCTPCSTSCSTCTGSTSNDCVICASGQYMLNGSCVPADSSGVCQGSALIADNNKHECDTCGAKCTKCSISNFNTASTVDQLKCTACLPGSFLSAGKCVESCPSGTFVSLTDKITCTSCDSSCSTCSGSSTFCLTCPSGQLAFNGKCVSSCPSSTFTSSTSSGSCTSCHPDCTTCSGGSFNQCLTCSSARPVLTNGRCLPTCSKNQYFDRTSSSCQSCNSSCSSCSGSGPSKCLACSSSTQVLRGGTCVSANCNETTNVIAGLGVCLSELVIVQASGTSSAAPLPSITGLTNPTVVINKKRSLEWWQILLMALGCAFIFLAFLMLWRRRARKQRAKRTAAFAKQKALLHQGGWRWRLQRFGEKLFGHKASTRSGNRDIELGEGDGEAIKLMRMREAEEAKHQREMDRLIQSYGDDYTTKAGSRSSRAPSTLPSLHHHHIIHHQHHLDTKSDTDRSSSHRLSSGSMYSQVTGIPRRIPEPRQPIRDDAKLLDVPVMQPQQVVNTSRFSDSSWGSSVYASNKRELLPPPKMTEAQAYVDEVRPSNSNTGLGSSGDQWLQPSYTGGSSKNPFRR